MKIVKRGIALLLLIATFTCQTLPEWGLTVYAAGMNAETTQSGEAEASSEGRTEESGDETGGSAEGETSGSEESTEAVSEGETAASAESDPDGDSGNTGKDDAQSGSKTPELDQLMETRKSPSTGSGSSGDSGSASSSGSDNTLQPTAPKKEIATDSQHESAGQIIVNKTGEQILKDIWGAVQEGYESDALKTMYQSEN